MVLAQKDVQKRWEDSLDIDGILAPLVAAKLIDHDNNYQELKAIAAKGPRRMALLRIMQTTLETREDLKTLLEIITKKCKQGFIARMIEDAWKEQTGYDL